MRSFHREGLEAERGLQTHQNRGCSRQRSQADPSHCPSRPCGCFMASRPASANPNSAGSGQNPASPTRARGTWATQQLTAQGPPTLLPARLFCKDYFKLTDKRASVFLNNFVQHDLKSHNFQIWSTNLWSPLRCNPRGSSSRPSAPPILCAGLPPLVTQPPLSQAQRGARVSSCNCIKWQHSSKHADSTVGNL